MIRKLHYTDLKKSYKDEIKAILKDKKTKQVEQDETHLGQKKGIEALKFGLKIKHDGYNIYISGESGTGKTKCAKKYATNLAMVEKTPDDVAYVYNFDETEKPIILTFKAGGGKVFKNDIQNLINSISTEATIKFSSTKYLNEKDEIVKKYQDLQEENIKQIANIAKEKSFELKSTKTSFYFLPIVEGSVISEEEFAALPFEKREEYNSILEDIQKDTINYANEIKSLDDEMKNKLIELEYNTFLFTVGYYTSFLQEKYFEFPKTAKYINDLKEDILKNRDIFIEQETQEDELINLISIPNSKQRENAFDKYDVNLIVDNSLEEGAPVVLSYKPNYTNLLGEIEIDNESGNIFTDYMKIKPGLLHKANGGYLILKVKDLLSYSYSFETLLKSLETKEINIEPIKEQQTGAMPIHYISPEKMPLDLKIILIGDEYYYDILSQFESNFSNFFKVHSIFDYEMDSSLENITNILKFIEDICYEENLLEPDEDAIDIFLQHLNRIVETQEKFTTKLNYLKQILIESSYFASDENYTEIRKEHIKKAIQNKINFTNIYEEKINDMILKDDIMINTDGSVVGQVNGLAVFDYGESYFGKPTKITATTYMGKLGIINIEKEAKMSGNIHSKGVQVLTGYLGQKYAQEFPLTLSCRLCFEQNYNGIDGDSASSTELYAILSSLAEVPISQQIAVTGSINQKGEIQAIGGVTQKIEGFFEICKARKLTGEQGVIIPHQNAKDLCLKDEVIEAVKNNEFNIYAINNIEEGIEILTNLPAGELDENGNYTKDSINSKVMKKLKSFYQKSCK